MSDTWSVELLVVTIDEYKPVLRAEDLCQRYRIDICLFLVICREKTFLMPELLHIDSSPL